MSELKSISKSEIDQAKQVSIVSILSSMGFEPLKSIGNELVYLSPLRNEKSGSFFVNPILNCFNDFGGDSESKGDSIRLLQLLKKLNFKQAIEQLIHRPPEQTPSFSFSGSNRNLSTENSIEIIHVSNLQHPALIQYIQNRKISLNLAKIYLKEIHYRIKGKNYFAVGFQNDLGGFELRNGLNFKGGKTVNAITTFNKGTHSIILFEGFFDFLSALEYYNTLEPIHTTIILNTCNNLSKALPILTNCTKIHSYLDNDQTGLKALETLKNKGFNIKNQSAILYPNCKDFNDYLIDYRNKEVTNQTNR